MKKKSKTSKKISEAMKAPKELITKMVEGAKGGSKSKDISSWSAKQLIAQALKMDIKWRLFRRDDLIEEIKKKM